MLGLVCKDGGGLWIGNEALELILWITKSFFDCELIKLTIFFSSTVAGEVMKSEEGRRLTGRGAAGEAARFSSIISCNRSRFFSVRLLFFCSFRLILWIFSSSLVIRP